MSFWKTALLFATFSLPCLITLPAFAQQQPLPSSDLYHQETNKSKLLRGVDTVVLTVSLTATYENGKPIPVRQDLQVDTETIRAKWEKKLHAAGIKTMSEAESKRSIAGPQTTVDALFVPPLDIGIVTGVNKDEKTGTNYWWSAAITLDKPMIPFEQSNQAGTTKKLPEIYSFAIWQDGYGYSLTPTDKLDDSIGKLLSGSVDKFVKDWRVANNKLLFDSFPKH